MDHGTGREGHDHMTRVGKGVPNFLVLECMAVLLVLVYYGYDHVLVVTPLSVNWQRGGGGLVYQSIFDIPCIPL